MVATMTWIRNICVKDDYGKICSACRNRNMVLSSFMTYHLVCNNSNTTGAISGAETIP